MCVSLLKIAASGCGWREVNDDVEGLRKREIKPLTIFDEHAGCVVALKSLPISPETAERIAALDVL
jgi:hypothetical protein